MWLVGGCNVSYNKYTTTVHAIPLYGVFTGRFCFQNVYRGCAPLCMQDGRMLSNAKSNRT